MGNGPDFLCIGMQKAATRTLYNLLSADPRFWMPLVKEFHHFGTQPTKVAERHEYTLAALPALQRGGYHLRVANAKRRAAGRRAMCGPDLEFLTRYKLYLDGGCQDADYLELFSVCPGGRKTGDVTPDYSGLDQSEIEKVHAMLPTTQILLIIRDPVARAWSHLNMRIRNNVPRRERRGPNRAANAASLVKAANSAELLPKFLKTSNLRAKGFPSETYRRWASVYGEDRIEVFSFEAVCNQPQQVVERVAEVVGAGPRLAHATLWRSLTGAGDGEAAPNSKANAPKLEMTDEDREVLVAHFRDEIIACQDLFGDKAAGWAEKYRIR